MGKVYKQISELGEIVTGKTPSTSKEEYWNGEIPFITPTDIQGYDTYYQSETERTVSNIGAKKQQKTVLPPNSICVTCIGSTIGKLCITKVESITNQQINSIIPNSKNDFRYVYYLMREGLPFFQMIAGGSGSGTPIISKNKFSKFKFPVEDNIDVQRKIAGILSAYDELIENNNKRIKILERMAENLYREWFVRFRFPGHENTPIVEGLPKSWKIVRYSQVCSIVAGGDYPNDYYDKQTVEYNVPIYSNGIINNGLYGFCKIAQVKEPAITISARGTVGFVALRLKPFLPIVRLLAIIPREFSVYYLYFYAKMAKMEGNGTSQQQLTKPMLNKRKVLLPDPHSLKLFDKHVVPIFEEIENLKLQCQILANQRDELLPRLMSGKLVVKTEI